MSKQLHGSHPVRVLSSEAQGQAFFSSAGLWNLFHRTPSPKQQSGSSCRRNDAGFPVTRQPVFMAALPAFLSFYLLLAPVSGLRPELGAACGGPNMGHGPPIAG